MTRPDKFDTIFIDSCVFIRHLTDPKAHPEAGAIFQLVDARKLVAFISSIHFVEVLGKQRTDAFDQAREDRAQALLTNPRLELVDLGPQVLQRARRYALHEGLKPMDAIHVASAVESGADVFMTYDTRLKLGRPIDGVWLDFPYEPGQPTLFSGGQ